MSGDSTPIYEPGDVVYGVDPFTGDRAARPWLIVSNHDGRPFHGEQYIALTLTTRSWHDDAIEIPDGAWTRGGTPEKSSVVPWGVQSIGIDDIETWQGTLNARLLETCVRDLIDEISRTGG